MSASSTVRPSILAVDDERANLNLLRRTFHREYDLHLAENGPAGIEFLKRYPIDMIICDQRMPGMTGVQMLVESLKISPYAIRIILTAYSDVRDIIESINEGRIYRYILKPWSPDELRVTVAKAFQHYRLENENRDLVVQLRASLEELKAAQEELVRQERLSTIGRMASSIIHDLKLPMTNIRAGASLLAGDRLEPARRKEFSDIILREVDRLTLMTREILDFSRGEMSLVREEFDLGALLAEIAEDLRRDFDDAALTLVRDWDELGVIDGDRNRLRRVFLNLALNARDAMHEGGRLTIHAGRDSRNFLLRFLDTGPGFPKEILDRIFEPFVTHGKHNGTGLGMTIARKIVEAHDGTIRAVNPKGGGALVEIELPA
ncbi:MAG: hybrid sensor histidine kinase/response regulator [Calditrichaeota bacterium]|nr:hybrid sensor histidine kinase/response regulator [Calditrichota bacterium]